MIRTRRSLVVNASTDAASRRQNRRGRKDARLMRAIEALEPRVLFTTYMVTTTADSGAGSLRQAILAANANPGADQITFNLGGVAPYSMTLSSALPTITDTVNLDATTQAGYAGAPLVMLDGGGSLSDGLVVAAPNSYIAGFAIGGFANSGITVTTGGDGSMVASNYVGVDTSGSMSDGNGRNGIEVQGVSNVVIRNNVVSGNFANGVDVTSSQGTTIAGNLIGVDASGTVAIANFGNGVMLNMDAFGTIVGGTNAADRNVIGNNFGDGVRFNTGGGIASGTNLVEGNYIGTDITGSAAMPNSNGVTVVEGSVGAQIVGNVLSGNYSEGAWIEDGALVQSNLIGVAADGTTPMHNWGDGVGIFSSGFSGTAGSTITGNTIAYNFADGVGVFGGINNAINGNSIHDNGSLDIDLGGDGVTPNDSLGHSGPNNYANFPVIANVDNAGGVVTITGTLDSTASMLFTLDFFASSAAGSSGYGPGQVYLGSTTVMTDASGHATFSAAFSNVPAGMNVATATATDADGNTSEFSFAQAIPAPRTLAGSVTTLASSSSPAVLNQPVTLTATVSAMSGTDVPSGSITFRDGATVLGVGTLVNGVATLIVNGLGVGSHTLTAVYGGDSEFAGSNSAAVSQVITKISTSTMVLSSSPTASVNSSVTFTATVSGADGGTPTGFVGFFDGANVIGQGTLVDGVATLTTSSLAIGSHTITAVYVDDANYANSTSAPITQTIGIASTTTTLSSSVNPALVGGTIVLSTHVTSLSGMPTGTVTFFDGSTVLGSANVLNDFAIFSISTLSLGTHNLTASYAGDGTFAASSSAALAQVVGKAATTLSLGTSLNPSTFGQSVTFSASVFTSFGSPTGTVTFFDGSTMLGTATIVNDLATITISTLSAGSHGITAVYGGDGNFSGSSSPVVQEAVSRAASSTSLSASSNVITIGQSLTFTATVTAATAGFTGTVTFTDGSNVLGVVQLVNGVAALTTSALTTGNHSVIATYSGDSNFGASASTAAAVTVNLMASSTALSSSVNPDVVGQSVTFTATVTSSSGTPSGSVTFMDGSAVLATVALDANGVAQFTSAALSTGGHSITATYSGDTNYVSSTSSGLTETVNKAATTTALSSSMNPAVVGQSVTFTATVTSSFGTASGSVTFMDGSTVLATVSLDASGVAKFTTAALSTGGHSITATYSGDTNYVSSASSALTETVNKATTTTALSSSMNPAVVGQSVTFTATVASSFGIPSGSVTFMDGSTVLATVSLDANGVAKFTTAALSTGGHSITASYSGDANDLSSTSSTLTETVNKATTTTTLSASVNPALVGQAVTFTATVASSSGTPSGLVTFMDGSTVLATVSLDANGMAKFTSAALSTGGHSITASYSGDANDLSSTSSTLTETVNQATTATGLSSSINPALVGQSVTFTATVTSSSGTPSGSVTFMDGSTALATVSLGAGGVAKFTTAALSAGGHSITAVYSGDANDLSSTSSALNETVNKASTTSTLSSSLNPATVGQSVTLTANVSTAGSVAATGTVTFFDGSTSIGTASLVSGVATLSTSFSAAGTHSLTARYSGDTANAASTSAALNEVVNAVTTASITGHVYEDQTGDGLSTDDTPLAGVTVELYLDRNANGKVDGSDTLVATAVSDANGVYAFTNLAAGHYVVQQVLPTGYTQTTPSGSTVYALNVTAGAALTGMDFDDFSGSSKTKGKKK
jgi:parallel beta-helix repeat protein